MGWLIDFLTFADSKNIIFFPYFAAAVLILILFLSRNSTFFAQNGLQLVTLAMLLPSLLFATGKGWVTHEALTAILSGIVGYVFGSGRSSSKPPGTGSAQPPAKKKGAAALGNPPQPEQPPQSN